MTVKQMSSALEVFVSNNSPVPRPGTVAAFPGGFGLQLPDAEDGIAGLYGIVSVIQDDSAGTLSPSYPPTVEWAGASLTLLGSAAPGKKSVYVFGGTIGGDRSFPLINFGCPSGKVFAGSICVVVFSPVTAASCTCTTGAGDAAVTITSGNWFFLCIGLGGATFEEFTFASAPGPGGVGFPSSTLMTYLSSDSSAGAPGLTPPSQVFPLASSPSGSGWIAAAVELS